MEGTDIAHQQCRAGVSAILIAFGLFERHPQLAHGLQI
jgi:hypothetical protein